MKKAIKIAVVGARAGNVLIGTPLLVKSLIKNCINETVTRETLKLEGAVYRKKSFGSFDLQRDKSVRLCEDLCINLEEEIIKIKDKNQG